MNHHEVEMTGKFVLFLFVVVVSVLGLRALRMPLVSGLVIAGAAAATFGPEGNQYLPYSHESIFLLAHFSVFGLFLCDGIDNSSDKLMRSWRLLFLSGSLQLVFTILLGALAALLIVEHCNLSKAFFVGMLMATSSSALVYFEIQRRDGEHTSEGEMGRQVLIFHDLAMLPFAMVTLSLAPAAEGGWFPQLAIGTAITAGVFALEFFFVSRLLDAIGTNYPKEHFYLVAFFIIMTTVYVCMHAQLSPAFGMFLGGILISRTKFKNFVRGPAGPIRDLALPFFFISVGLLVSWHTFTEHWAKILFSAIGMITLKVLATFIAAAMMGLTTRSALRLGGYLAHIGESSFVLGLMGKELGLLDKEDSQVLLMLAIISLALSPALNSLIARFEHLVPDCRFMSLPYVLKLWHMPQIKKEGHVVIVGYGRIGTAVALLFHPSRKHLACIVIESRKDRHDVAEHDGHVTLFADATQEFAFLAANTTKARAVLLTDCTVDIVRALAISLIGCPTIPALVFRVHRRDQAEEIENDYRGTFPLMRVVCSQDEAFNPFLDQCCELVGVPRYDVKPAPAVSVETQTISSTASATVPVAALPTVPATVPETVSPTTGEAK